VNNLNKYTLNKNIENEFFNKIDCNILQDLKKILENNPLKNMQDASRLPVKLESIQDFKNILKFINYGRNNLFHGDKSLDCERDRKIVTYGSRLLEPLLGAIIK